jgi:phage terminase large subunit
LAAEDNPLDEFIVRYGNDPVLFVREVLGADPDEEQSQVLRWIAAGERRISVKSGHGVGKTTVIAWALVWFACTRFPQKSVCTAPTATQLFDALAAETKAWFKKLPPTLFELFEIQTEQIKLRAAPEESFIAFRTSKAETPEAMAGVHSENVLLIADEASGVPNAVFEASIGSMSSAHATMLLAGNPVRSSGLFYDTHNNSAIIEDWKRLTISGLNHPRVDQDLVRQVVATYGEKSNAYRVRILGEFPLSDDDTVIPYELIASAQTREVKPINVMPIWGVDVARFGNDNSALAKRKGNVLLAPVEEKWGYDTMVVAGWIKSEWDNTAIDDRPSEINVDVIGIGAGVVDRLSELGLPVRGINVSESPAMKDQFPNLRSELWFDGRDWFAAMDCHIPPEDEKLALELMKPRFKFTSAGKRQVESKDEMKKRKLASPNKADAFLLTLASDAISLSNGPQSKQSWKTPIKRALKGLV